MTEEQRASTEPVSTLEPVSPPTDTEPVAPQPLTEERIQQMIAEATAKAVLEAKQLGRRELQSEQDRNKADLARMQRRAQTSERTLGAIRSHVQTLDPEVGRELELAELRTREQERFAQEQEEQVEQYKTQTVQKFQDNMNQFIVGLGVNPQDQKIDWAADAPDLLEKQRRILDSVVKIQKETAGALELSIDRKIKEATERVKRELGYEDVNSVETSLSSGVSGKGIPTNMVRFQDWVKKLPDNEYEKLRPDIEKMLAEGKIK